MNIGAILALGMLNLGDKEEEEGSGRMTDQQFKAFVKLCLTVAKATSEVKEFKKHISLGSSSDALDTCKVFIEMLIKVAESTGSTEKVQQVLQEILDDL